MRQPAEQCWAWREARLTAGEARQPSAGAAEMGWRIRRQIAQPGPADPSSLTRTIGARSL